MTSWHEAPAGRQQPAHYTHRTHKVGTTKPIKKIIFKEDKSIQHTMNTDIKWVRGVARGVAYLHGGGSMFVVKYESSLYLLVYVFSCLHLGLLGQCLGLKGGKGLQLLLRR